jgi:hypothetical protein
LAGGLIRSGADEKKNKIPDLGVKIPEIRVKLQPANP